MPANDLGILVSLTPACTLPFDGALMQLKHADPQVKLVGARG